MSIASDVSRGPAPPAAASPARARGGWIPFAAVLVAAWLAFIPTWFAGRLPAETDWLTRTGPWATRIGDTLHHDEGGDSFLIYLPDRLEAVRQWRSGRLPLWNPWVGCGEPLLGTQAANPLDPTILLHFFLPLAWALALTFYLGLATAGCGLVLLLRQQGLRRPGALAVGGIAFALNPYFVNWLELRVFVAGLATLPGALWALGEIGAGRAPRRNAGLLALALGLALLGGTLQTMFLFLALLGLRGAYLAIVGMRAAPDAPGAPEGGAWPPRVAWIAAGLLIGLALGGLALASALEAYAQSTRAQAGAGYYAGANALNWRALALWFNPGAFGWPREELFVLNDLLGHTMGGGSGWGSPGLVPLGLALLALTRRAGPRRERVFWGGLSGGVLLFLLAQPFGLHALLLRLWPNLDSVDLLRGLFAANLGFSILAAWGADALLDLCDDPAPWRTGILPLLGLVGVGCVLLALVRRGVWMPTHPLLFDLVPVVVTGFALLLLCVTGAGVPRARHWRAGLLAGLIALELLDLHYHFNAFSAPATAYPSLPVLTGLARAQATPERSRLVIPGGTRLLPPNLAVAFQLDEIRSYTNMPPARLRLLLDCAEGHAARNKTQIEKPASPIYRLLGGGLLFPFWPEAKVDSLFVGEPVTGGTLYRRRDALPRAFLVHRVEPLAGEAAARERLARPDFDPARVAYLEPAAGALPPVAEATAPEQVTLERVEADRLTLAVRASAPALLVVANTWFPGWRATLDGTATPVHPADWGVQGVALPAGTHRVEIFYRPAWLGPGMAATIIALLLIAGACVPPDRPRRPADAPPAAPRAPRRTRR